MVRFSPIWTDTGLPSISTVVLPLRYQPSEPVENSLTSAISGTPATVTVTGLALAGLFGSFAPASADETGPRQTKARPKSRAAAAPAEPAPPPRPLPPPLPSTAAGDDDVAAELVGILERTESVDTFVVTLEALV